MHPDTLKGLAKMDPTVESTPESIKVQLSNEIRNHKEFTNTERAILIGFIRSWHGNAVDLLVGIGAKISKIKASKQPIKPSPPTHQEEFKINGGTVFQMTSASAAMAMATCEEQERETLLPGEPTANEK